MRGLVESFNFVKSLGVVDFKVVEEEKNLSEFGFPCFLKVDLGMHKTEAGGVLECFDFADAKRKLVEMRKRFVGSRIVVQRKVVGVEMIVGLKEDVVFGQVLMVGFGGIFAEVKRDVSFRALPVSRKDVKEMVCELGGFGVFDARGKKYALERFYGLVERVARMKHVGEMDLNPVIVGEGFVKVVDARVD
jgi:hypothetical protein